MKLLYLSCHSILEYDELSMFEELGYDYFSIGAYINPQQPHDVKRPALHGQYHEHLASVTMVHHQGNLHPEQIDWADIIIVMHIPDWIESNWPLFSEAIKKGKRVIWRTIGQSTASVEARIRPYREQGLEIVRYSPAEENIPGYCGGDAVIRFAKDPNEFGGWTGEQRQVITVGQSMRKRGDHCNYDLFERATEDIPRRVFGSDNDDIPDWGGQLTYCKLKEELRKNRVFFFTGTHPASYTLGFIEALMTGIPIVAIGHLWGNNRIYGQKTYEVPSIIRNGVNGYCFDDLDDMRRFIRELLEHDGLAGNISKAGRQTALELFARKPVKEQWAAYLEKGAA